MHLSNAQFFSSLLAGLSRGLGLDSRNVENFRREELSGGFHSLREPLHSTRRLLQHIRCRLEMVLVDKNG